MSLIGPVLLSVATAITVVAAITGAADARAAGGMRRRLGVDASGRPRRAIARDGAAVPTDLRRRRARRRSERDVPELIDGVVRQLRTGATLRHAIQRIGSRATDPSTRRLADDLRTGRSVRSSIDAWRREEPAPNRRLAAIAMDLAVVSGGASARVLDGVAETLRDRVALEREVDALSVQARLSAAVLVVAPFGFAFLAASIDHRIVEVLRTPIGLVCVVLGVVLDAVGAWWMFRQVERAR